jgi:hypothetical protein
MRLLWAGAAVLLLQSPTIAPAFAQAAAPPSPAGKQAGPAQVIPVPRPVPQGGAHLGTAALPTLGTAPPTIAPARLAQIAAAAKPSPPPTATKRPPAHGVLLPPAPSLPRVHPGAPSTAAPRSAGARGKPLGIPAPPAVATTPHVPPQSPLAIGSSLQVDNSTGCGFGATEPSVAQSKANPSFMVVAAQEYQDNSGCADSHAWAFTSHDAGQHWQATLLPGLQQPASGDVAVTFDPVRQVFVYSFLEFSRTNAAVGRVGVETSVDGLTWGQDTTLASDSATIVLDKDAITVDQNPTSPHFGRVVVTWTEFAPTGLSSFVDAFSDSGGSSWTGASDMINITNECGNGTSPAFDAHGNVMTAWWSCDASPDQLKEELSTDGGASWGQPNDTVITSINDIGTNSACLLNAGGTAFRCNSFPSLAGDPNPNDEGGTAFVVVWADEDTLAQGRGKFTLNDGSSWSGFFHVDFADSGDKFFPAAAFAANGRLNIGYSNRNVSATSSNRNGTSYNEWVTEAGSLASLVADSFITFNVAAAASNPGTLGFIGDYSSTSSLDNNFDTFPAFADQRGSSNNHVSTINLCYANCFTSLTPYTPVAAGSASFTDLYEYNTNPSFGGSGFDFWNAVGIREGADGTSVDDDTVLFGDRYFSSFLVSSTFSPPNNDYTVENDNSGHSPPATYFPQVHSFSTIGGPYTIEWASGFRILSVGSGLADSMGGANVVKVYDAFLNTGTTYDVGLRPASGNTSNYSLNLHSASRGNQQGRPSAAANSGNVAAGQPAFISYSTGSDATQFDGVVATNNNGGTGSYTIFTDAAVPTGSININGGAATTGSHHVTLNLAASNPNASDPVFDMRFSNDGTTFGAWAPFSASAAYTLPAGVGTHTVFVQYRNGAGGVSATFSHGIFTTT